MSADKFFPQRPDFQPMIYGYEDTNPQYAGLLKVGYTAAMQEPDKQLDKKDGSG